MLLIYFLMGKIQSLCFLRKMLALSKYSPDETTIPAFPKSLPVQSDKCGTGRPEALILALAFGPQLSNLGQVPWPCLASDAFFVE